MFDKIKDLIARYKGVSVSHGSEIESNNTPKVILQKQILRAMLLIGIVFITLLVITKLITRKGGARDEKEEELAAGQVKIEVASKSLDPEKMWRNHFEDKLIDSQNKMVGKLELIEESFSKKEEELVDITRREIASMGEQLKFAKEELREALSELKAAREQISSNEKSDQEHLVLPVNITSQTIDDERNIARPKSSKNFIPETAYLKGIMLNGISVSTSISSSSEPVPVVIRIIDRGNLPRDFELDLKSCRILGSSYGDLSSERAIIRAEVMSCTDKASGQIITTHIAGAVFGDDGMGGIKGKVVQTSNKHIQHAFVGGLLSGFAGVAKSGEQFSITGAGAISTRVPGLQDKIRDGGISGLGSAGEKIADYYLRQAEAMSPVLQVPGGTRVDIVFTKGVYVGSSDVRKQIAKARGRQEGEQAHE